MNSSFLIVFIFLLVVFYGLVKKVNCYDSFINGVKEGSKSVINMFSFILTFNIAISLLNSSGIIDYFINKFSFSYLNLLIQAIVRPFSSSSSLAIMLDIYEKYGVDSLIGLFSTFIHSVTDTTFYIISFYFGSIGIRNLKKVIFSGVIVNIIGVILSFIIIFLFFS